MLLFTNMETWRDLGRINIPRTDRARIGQMSLPCKVWKLLMEIIIVLDVPMEFLNVLFGG